MTDYNSWDFHKAITEKKPQPRPSPSPAPEPPQSETDRPVLRLTKREQELNREKQE